MLRHLRQKRINLVVSLLFRFCYRELSILSDDTWVLISPYSIGDTYLLCALAKHLLLENGGAGVTLLLRASHMDVAELFPEDIAQKLPLHEKHLYWFRRARSPLPLQPGIPIVAHPRNHEAFSADPRKWKRTESMLNQYLNFFHLPLNTPLSKPVVSSVAYFKAKERLHVLGLPEQRTVILAPDAVSVKTLPPSFWHIMSHELRRSGWSVCFNSSGTSYPLSEAIPVAELAGWVISMRSGLCDLISTANCRLSVIYPEKTNSVLSPLEEYSLKNQGLPSTVEEFEADLSDDFLLLAQKIITGRAQ
jgi:hypothetical protein